MNIFSYIGVIAVEEFVCSENSPHNDIIDSIGAALPDDETLCELAEFFRVFGDSTRIRILYALSKAEMCVCDIAALLGVSQSAVSHQLQILRSRRLVKYRRDGKTVFYSLNDEHIFSIIGQGIEHIKE